MQAMLQPRATVRSSWWSPHLGKLQPWDVAGITKEPFSNTRHAGVDTNEALRALSNLHKSSKPSACET